jgi:hypothetical protein
MPSAPDNNVLSPSTVQFINAADSDLFIETANCEAAKYYKTLPMFSTFGSAWNKAVAEFVPRKRERGLPGAAPSTRLARHGPSRALIGSAAVRERE